MESVQLVEILAHITLESIHKNTTYQDIDVSYLVEYSKGI